MKYPTQLEAEAAEEVTGFSFACGTASEIDELNRVKSIIQAAIEKALRYRNRGFDKPLIGQGATSFALQEQREQSRAAQASDQIIEIVKREIDDCDHPECEAERRQHGYSTCAGGHIAKRVVEAISRAAHASEEPAHASEELIDNIMGDLVRETNIFPNQVERAKQILRKRLSVKKKVMNAGLKKVKK